MLLKSPTADVCLILEGTYPYTMGGVSSWTHELIKMQSHLTFAIVALVSSTAPTKLLYELPSNVKYIQTIRLQCLPKTNDLLSPKQEHELFSSLEQPLLRLQSRADLNDLADIIKEISSHRHLLGEELLLNSKAAWNLLLKMYHRTMPNASFIDYFWSWRGLFGGLFSVLLAPLPEARTYHALCTGYAGILLARAHLETGTNCVITEHGIYTNERRIEIASADWLDDPHAFNLSVNYSELDRELKDFWIDTFSNYSRLCYESCNKIVTLYKGNQEFQLIDGASPHKLQIIPNGIDYEQYSAIKKNPHPPTVALIGRVVPIKDIKTYIKAIAILKNAMPKIHALMIGPSDEDPEYAQECFDLVQHLKLEDNFTFTGKVNVEDYLGKIDVIVLTSISEAQPLVILEAGAAGIPTVATDVGACREIIMGDNNEHSSADAGGVIVPLANPKATADALLKLLTEPDYYHHCSHNIKSRVKEHYNKVDQYNAYAKLYHELTTVNNHFETPQQSLETMQLVV